MLARKFILLISLSLHTTSDSNNYPRKAIEFWSSVVCSLDNLKILDFHYVLDGDRSFASLQRDCSEIFLRDVARKCETTTILLKTHVLRDPRNTFYSSSNNKMVHGTMKRSAIRKIASENVITSQAISPSIERIPVQNNEEGNTWHVHVILARDIQSFDLVSKDDSIFSWNPRDRFIVLIARSNEHRHRLDESDVRIEDVLKSLWSKRKVQAVFISEIVPDTSPADRVLYTYNPFAKINDYVWGKIEIINVKTAKQASNILSRLTYRRTKDLNGYELKVGLFEQNESAAGVTNVQSNNASYYYDIFTGFDEAILNMITERMNFQVKETYPTDDKSHGYQLSNGTYVGVIGDVVHGRADICFVTFFQKKYSADPREDVDFSTYVNFDRVCMIVPKAPKIPKGLRIYHFFPLSVWICSTLSHVLVYLAWYLMQIFSLDRRTRRTTFLETVYRSFLLNAGCPQKLPNTNPERILLTGIFLASITLVGIFNGILYNSFAHDMYYPDIDSLRDLDESGLPISLASFSLIDLFGAREDVNSSAIMRSLRKKLRYGLNTIYNAAYYRNVSGIVREHHFPIISEDLIDANGGPLLHLVEECPGGYYLSYLLPRNSILQERINVLIGRLNQAGLPSLWNRRVLQAFMTQKRSLAKQKLMRNEKEVNGFVPFNLSDVQSSFYMLLIGLLISMIVFFHEKRWPRTFPCRVRGKPGKIYVPIIKR